MTASEQFAMIPLSLLYDSEVPRDAKLVYAMLAGHGNGEGASWPSHGRIADCLGMSKSQAKRMLNWLRDHGYITWSQRRRDDAALTSNEYRLMPPEASTPARKLGSVVTHLGSPRPPLGPVVTHLGPEGADPRVQESGGIAPRELENQNHKNQTQGTTSSPPSASAPTKAEVDAMFDEFWAVYPRKVGKGAARPKFASALKRASFDALLTGAKHYRDDPNRVDQYTAHPTTWLNRDGWDDAPLPPRATRNERSEPRREIDWSSVGGAR